MIRRISEKLLMRPGDLKPSHDDLTVIGVFNPGAVKVNDEIILLARVAEEPLERRPGFVGLPRLGPEGDIVVDWRPKHELDQSDPRFVRSKDDNLLRLTSISHLRTFHSDDGLSEFLPFGPSFVPESPAEEYGMEDPRITEIEGRHWITYVAVSRHGAATALASTNDFVKFERHGVIFCPENKDVVLFSQKMHGDYVSLHRPNPNSQFGRPQIWLARSPNLLSWGKHECLFAGAAEWEGDRVGAGTPPIALEEGWLEIYHGSRRPPRAGEVGAYSAGALLLDRDNPSHILKRSRGPIMQPTTEFERTGFVANVVFPTGLIEQSASLLVYYGAADTFIGVIEFSRKEMLAALH